MISSSATTASPPIPASFDRNSKLRLAQREARNARRHGDDDTAVLWYGVAIRELRGSTSAAGQAERQQQQQQQQQELLGALLVKRGSARRRLQAQLLRRRETRGRAHGLGEEALADYVEAVWRHPGQVKAHRKRIEIALSNGCALPVLLSLCADVHGAMGLATDPTAVQWQLSQLEPEPEEGAETMHRDDAAAAAAAASEHVECSDGALRAATVCAVLPALERTIVAELTAKHVTYDDGSLASVAEAVAAEAQLAAQPHAHEGVVLRGSKLERQRQEAAALWVLLRHAGPADLAGCGNTLCQRLVAHLAADLGQPTSGSQEEQWRLLLLARCRTALQLMAGLRGLGLQPWCVNSQQFRRPVQERHRHEPAHAQRLAHRAAEVENRAAAASMRALLMRAEAGAGAGAGLSPSSLTSSSAGTAFGDAAGDGSALQSAESAAAVLAAQVAAEGHHMHAEAQRTRLLRQRNQTDREEGRTENYGPGPFRLPTEITLVLNDEWEPLCDSLQQWIRSLSGSTMDGGVN